MRRCGISRVPVAARRRGGGARREPLQSALCRRLNVCQELMSYTANVGRQRTEFQNGVCCWVLAAGADARNLPRELLRSQATQRMRLHRTTTSHHPCTGAGQADAVEFLFPDDGRGIYAAHTYATGDFVSVRSASTSSSGNLPCLCCARHHVTSRHAALRHSRAFPSILPSSRSKTHQGTPPRKSITCCLVCDATARRRL